MTNTYDRVMKMPLITRKEWIHNAQVYGLACTCKNQTRDTYCAKHDPRIQALLAETNANDFESDF